MEKLQLDTRDSVILHLRVCYLPGSLWPVIDRNRMSQISIFADLFFALMANPNLINLYHFYHSSSFHPPKMINC